jgi:hypothetical protein
MASVYRRCGPRVARAVVLTGPICGLSGAGILTLYQSGLLVRSTWLRPSNSVDYHPAFRFSRFVSVSCNSDLM